MPITIDFQRTHEGLVFRDALLLTDAEHAALTPEQIAAMQEARFQSWVASLSAGEE
jgi:hypothetical protein